MFKIKNLLLCLIIFFLSSNSFAYDVYDMSTPLKGQSIATDALQKKVLKSVYPIALQRNSLCTNFKIIDTQLLHYPYDVEKKKNKIINGYWKELWTVDSCGHKMQVPITFTINKKKTYFSIDAVNTN